MNIKSIHRGLLSILLTGALYLLLPAKAAADDSQWNLYFGLLHAHTSISDGKGTVEEAFSQAAAVDGLDFFAVTDHSNSFDNAQAGAIGLDGTAISSEWAAGKAAAANVTNENFVGIFGYEMTWRDSDYLGHISTFGTPGWISRNQEGFSSLTAYYDALTTAAGSVSQFNHPGTDYGDFQNFSHWSEDYDRAISLLEVGGENGFTAYAAYETALEKGWHLAPTNSHNNHNGLWGTAGESRTVILAEALTEESLYEAMKNRRVYATEDRDLEIRYRLNGQIMGSVTGLTDTITITAQLHDPTDDAIGKVEVRSGGDTVAGQTVNSASGEISLTLTGKCGYYYLRITQPDGDIAVTAPVWVTQPEEPSAESPEPEETEPEPSEPEEEMPGGTLPEDLGIMPRFGLLHSHSSLSGYGPEVEVLFAQAADTENLDYFAVTDSSQSFRNAESGAITADGTAISPDWARGKAAAAAVTTDAFTGLFGYEMEWPDDRNLGHIATFGTPGWTGRNQEGFSTLTAYYDALTTVPGAVSQFNHPGPDVGEFENFRHHQADYDAALSLLEIGDGQSFAYYDQYVRALDQGWHLGPTVGQAQLEESKLRTVILAEDLSEAGLLEAMRRRRVYATEDADLSLYFTLDDAPVGDITRSEESHSLRLFTADPTDASPGIVQIITDGGLAAAREELPMNGSLELTIPGGGSYYFLQITQADGDVAVTAPVWTDSYEDVSIRELTADTALPMQGAEISLDFTVCNEEIVDFQLEQISLYVEDVLVFTDEEPYRIPAGCEKAFSIPYIHPLPGIAEFRLEILGTVGGVERSVHKTLTLSFQTREMVSGILIHRGHSSCSPEAFQNLISIAAEAHMEVTFFDHDLPDTGNVLILLPPEKPYEPEFLQQVKIFCARGGSLVVCGDSGENREALQQLNRLLQIVGSTMSLREDTIRDPVHNGGDPEDLYPSKINRDTQWCADTEDGAFYIHRKGCSLSVGKGTWLVQAGDTAVSSLTGDTSPVVLAWEELPKGGHIFAAGSHFLADDAMPLPKNRWDTPRVNLTVTQALLGISGKQLPLSTISEVRSGEPKKLYRIRGHATSGTSNPFTTFPDTLYIQDETGGIAITSFRDGGIQVGQSIDAVGYLDEKAENLVLVLVDYRLRDAPMFRYVPETLNHSRAMDYDARGGQLLQVEAEVTTVTLTEDGQGISRFTLVDEWGDKATVLIEDYIRSGAYGDNTLASQVKIGRKVRAMGLLHLDENRIPVLRVRNCEEVVWVPPIPRPEDKDNPYTGDNIGTWGTCLSLSLLGILFVCGRRKPNRQLQQPSGRNADEQKVGSG